MANEEHLAILKQGVEAWNQWRKRNPDIRPDLSEADLHSANLHGADLSGANLSGADLSGAYLLVTDLAGARLKKARLVGADLAMTYLDGTDLSEADFGGARLDKADLCGANVEHAVLSYTIFADVDLSEVKGLEAVRHMGSSTIGIDTLYQSKGKIPQVFLRGCGVPDRMIAFIASLPGQPETYRTRLRLNLGKCFDESELRDLCFDMGVDYESLKGESKSDKVRELVAYCERRQIVPNLVAKCRELRPKVSWEGEYE